MSDSDSTTLDNIENFDEIPSPPTTDTPPVTMKRTPPSPPSLSEESETSSVTTEQSVSQSTNIIGMNLKTSLGGLTGNLVALACQHKMSSSSTNILNNFQKDLLSYSAIKLKHTHSKDIKILNTGSDENLSDKVSYYVLDSSNNRNLSDVKDENKKNSQKLFSLIKQCIANDSDIDKGTVRSSKREEIITKNDELVTLSGVKDLKFAALKNACTQIIFGFERNKETNMINEVVGRIQTIGAGPSGAVQSGDFSMKLTGDKYVISTKKDVAPTIITLLKKILKLDKDIEVVEEQPVEEQPVDEQPVEEQSVEEQQGGKTRRRKPSKRGTRKHKPKRTMRKKKHSKRHSIKK